MPHSKSIGRGLFELRIRGKKEIRIIYCYHRNEIVLLKAFIKKTQKIPKRFLTQAKERQSSLD